MTIQTQSFRSGHDTQDKVVAPGSLPCRPSVLSWTVALTCVLLAFASGGFAQTQQASAANLSIASDAGKAVVEKQPLTTASTGTPSQPQSAAGLSKEISNPLSSMWLLQLQQNNTLVNMPSGEGTSVQSNLQFQPLLPIPLSSNWNLISRPVIQVFSSQPYPAATSADGNAQTTNANLKRSSGFGDTIFATTLSPGKSLVGNWLLAAGPTFVLPTATDHQLGQDTWQAGPAVALGYSGSKWLGFVFPQHWWKVGGDGKKTNQTTVLYNFNWNFNSGWSVGTSPNLTVNWEAPRNQRVSFPLGLQGGKLLHAGPMPMKAELQVMYYAVRPTQAYGTAVPSPKWGFQLQLTPVIPALIHGHKPI